MSTCSSCRNSTYLSSIASWNSLTPFSPNGLPSFHPSTFTGSSGGTPDEAAWGPFTQNTFNVMPDPSSMLPPPPHPPVQAGHADSTGPNNGVPSSPTDNTERSSTHFTTPQHHATTSATMRVNPTPAVDISSGTVNPQDTRLSAGSTQVIPAAYQLHHSSSVPTNVEMTPANK